MNRFMLLVLGFVALANILTAQSPKMTSLPKDVKPFEYVEAKVPFYPAGQEVGDHRQDDDADAAAGRRPRSR